MPGGREPMRLRDELALLGLATPTQRSQRAEPAFRRLVAALLALGGLAGLVAWLRV